MPLFRRKQETTAGPPPDRRIPRLEPTYYEEIHAALHGNGGSDSVADIAFGVANAIENIGHKLLQGEPWNARKFDSRFGSHSKEDLSAADEMIDWLIWWDGSAQEPLETVLGRLKEVLSKPAEA